jgi:hypothetical protein
MSGRIDTTVPFTFETEVFYWRGPSPFFFASVPPPQASELRRMVRLVTYGWGMIPVEASVGDITFGTSLFPKDETYLLPLKAEVRRKAGITAGDRISVTMTVQAARR